MNIRLKKLTVHDATQKYCDWLNDDKVNKYLETRKSTIEELVNYIKEKNDKKNCALFGIFDGSNHIGNIKLEPILKNECSIGIIIGEKNYWGRGVATTAIKLVLNYCDNVLKLKTVKLGVISENKAAIKAYKKCGFTITRIKNKALKHGDILYDKVEMNYQFKK